MPLPHRLRLHEGVSNKRTFLKDLSTASRVSQTHRLLRTNLKQYIMRIFERSMCEAPSISALCLPQVSVIPSLQRYLILHEKKDCVQYLRLFLIEKDVFNKVDPTHPAIILGPSICPGQLTYPVISFRLPAASESLVHKIRNLKMTDELGLTHLPLAPPRGILSVCRSNSSPAMLTTVIEIQVA